MDKAIHKAGALIEALDYIQRFRGKRVVVKMGGTLMDDRSAEDSMLIDLVFMAAVGIRPIVVHGGGKEITGAMKDSGIEARFVQGRRYTDERALKIAEHVLCNSINARLVQTLRANHADAVGLHSLSSCVLTGERIFLQGDEGRRIDLGFVGKVTKVHAQLLDVLCDAGTIPVIAPIALDRAGGKLNVNADDVAGEVAAAIKAEKLVLVSDTHGIRMDVNDPASRISELKRHEVDELISSGVIAGGMVPKVQSCLRALDGGVHKTHIIDGRIKHSLLLEIYTHMGIGTQIINEAQA